MPQQMGTTKTSLPQVRRFNRFLHLLIVAWTLLIIISFARSWVQHSRHAQDLARKEARSRFLMEMAYRQWVMRLGGVYVPVTPQTPPNPYLADIPYRDIRAPSGTLLTLVNSSYMTRQVSELLQASPGPRHHITSLKPLRPENAPDEWEAQALRAFADGATEVSSIENQNQQPHMRLMRPLITDENCLKCHARQGYQTGDVQGGISVSVPMQPCQDVMRAELSTGFMIHGLLWACGMLGLWQGGRRLRGSILERERAAAEQAALREQLHQSQKMEAIGQLAGGVAHDFNNLLTVILLNLDIMESRMPICETVSEAATTVRNAAEQAVGLTRSLLIFSRRLPAEKKPVRLQEVIQPIASMLRRLLPASIEVVTDDDAKSGLWVHADATQLQQVVINLAINARDAMPEGGTLHIRLWAEEAASPSDLPLPRHACLSVSDTGMGIPPDVQPRLFEPFFSTKPRGHGTGLGLAIVQSIVENHDGQIQVQSQLGKGSTFTIILPCTAPLDIVQPAPKAIQPPRGQGETILLIEDNEFVRDSIGEMLRRLGYDVIAEADGRAGAQEWQRQHERIRLVILDMDLPGKTGLECLQSLREKGSSIPAILISGRPDWNHADLSDTGATTLQKPFRADQLAETVYRLLHPADMQG
ncbi:MAG: DUF3365 domain-containing protein [Phycisphaerae bacterium]|nr:DUF3365 domain-containing protein [Phycisphaerae bacterium]